MSIKAMEWAQDVRTETVAQKAVLLLLADEHQNKTGRCACSVPTLARQTSLSDRQVTRIIKRLEELGIVVREQDPGRPIQYSFPGLAQRQLDLQQLDEARRQQVTPDAGVTPDKMSPPKPEEPCHPRHPCQGRGDMGVRGGVTRVSPHNGVTGLTGNPPPESPEFNLAEIQVPPTDPEITFDAWWARWPKHGRKIGRAKAERLWSRLSPRHRAQAWSDLVDEDRPNRDPQWLKDGGAYIPQPSTYLNQDRFDDEWIPVEAGHEYTETRQRRDGGPGVGRAVDRAIAHHRGKLAGQARG